MTNLRLEKRGNVWQYSFEAARVGGKRKRISKSGFRTKAEASAAGAKAMSEYREYGKQITQSNISYEDFITEWLNKYCIPNLKKTTIADYQYIAKKYICPDLGKYRIKEMTSELLQDFLVKYAKKGTSRNELVTLKTFLSGTLKYARKRNFITSNPMENVSIPSIRSDTVIPRNRPNSFITSEKMDLILARFPKGTDMHIPLLLGYRCGLRRGETFGLFWEDIDFEHKTLSIKRQVQTTKNKLEWYITTPKYESERTIDLDDDTINVLKERKQQLEDFKKVYGTYYTKNYVDENGIINFNGKGKEVFPINIEENGKWLFPRSLFKTSSIIKSELGVSEFTYHSLRGTHSTMLLDNGAPPIYVKNRLGHKNLAVTFKSYQYYTDRAQSEGLNVLSKIY